MIRTLIAAVALCCGLVCTAGAQEVTGDNQPDDTAKAEVTTAKDCVTFASDFRMFEGAPAYVITLENKCERRFRCKVNVGIMNAYGQAHGQATLRLAPRGDGDGARKTYALKVKQLGGMAQEQRQCEAL